MIINEIATTIVALKWGKSIAKFEKTNPEDINTLRDATKFMPTDTSNFIRALVITSDIHERPMCTCGTLVTWNTAHKTFNQYCSTKCRCNDPTFQQKQQKRLQAKYGVTNISNIPGVADKKKQTCSKHHGVEYPQQSISIKAKTKQNIINKYGVDHPTKHPDIANKIRNTNIDRYGVEYPIASTSIQNRIKKQNLEQHGVEFALQRKDVKDKIRATNIKTHGVEYPMMSKQIKQTREKNNLMVYGVKYPNQQHIQLDKLDNFNWLYNQHITNQLPLIDIAALLAVDWSTVKKYLDLHNIEHTLYPIFSNEKRIKTSQARFDNNHYNQQHIPQQSLQRLRDREWMYNEHITNKLPLYIIGQNLGCSDGTVGRYLHAHGIPTQLQQQSVGEQEIADFISSLNIKLITNDRSIIHPLELDMYLPDYTLAIEYCGLYWHSEQQGKDKHYHKHKMECCNNLGIRLITIYEDEWLNNTQLIKNKISSIVGIPTDPPVYARKTKIVSVPHHTSKPFFDSYHIQGGGIGSVTYGLMHNSELVACMSFMVNKTHHTLSRYATSKSVIGGFSKLVNHFTKNHPKWTSIVSFADLRWSEGNVYKKMGWKMDSVLPPDYYYATSNTNRFHKSNFRRKYLPKRLKSFDPSLSERVNCDNNGILRIWDCGKIRFVLHNS